MNMHAIIDAPQVRLADLSDEDELVELTRAAHKETGLRYDSNEPLPFSEKKVRAMVRRIIPQYHNCVIGIIGSPGQMQGSVCIVRDEPWYSEQEIIQEKWNFVFPEYRKSNNAQTLIAFSKAVACAWQRRLIMCVMSTERQPAKMRLYRRQIGCEPFGGFFVFDYNQSVGG